MRSRGWITVGLFVLVGWGLFLVTGHLTDSVIDDGKGNVVDAYQRSSDVLHVLLPLLTIALGYWFGAEGKESAEQKATVAQQQLNAVLGSSADPELLLKARNAHPEAFPPAAGKPAAGPGSTKSPTP